jgi:hypothetical protein
MSKNEKKIKRLRSRRTVERIDLLGVGVKMKSEKEIVIKHHQAVDKV